MKCLYPKTYKLFNNHISEKDYIAFNNIPKSKLDTYKYNITLRCNKCIFCQKYNSYHLYNKLMSEWETNKNNKNYFITFTYANNNIKEINKIHLQKLFKKMRKHDLTFKYYAIGEYGDINKRPHYHILFFNLTGLDELIPWNLTPPFNNYRSRKLTQIWKYGIVDIEPIHEMNIKYIAKHQYKTNSKIKLKLYSKSLGKEHLIKNLNQISEYYEQINNGQQTKINNYQKNQLKNYWPEIYEKLKLWNETHKPEPKIYNLITEEQEIKNKEKWLLNEKIRKKLII